MLYLNCPTCLKPLAFYELDFKPKKMKFVMILIIQKKR